MFQGRITQEKKQLILEFEDLHPKSLATIGYGSGVIPQDNSNPNDKKELDVIDVVEDLQAWLFENMEMHPEEFTPATLRFFKKATLEKLEQGAPIIYFSRDCYKGQYIKRGIISKQQFLSSCYNRTSSFVPFRMEKVTELIRCQDDEIYQALVYDHQITLILALLMLPADKHNLYDLMMCICSMSFLGDFRMKIHCEDPNKIKNIVNKQFKYFCEDYSEVNMGYYEMINETDFSVNYARLEEDISKLPKCIIELVGHYPSDEYGLPEIEEVLKHYFIGESKRENFDQTIKGIKTIGVKKSLAYGLRKLKKGMKK